MRAAPIVCIVVLILVSSGAYAMVEMKGSLKGFAGSRGRVGSNKVSVISHVDPTSRPAPSPKILQYNKTIPSAYRFDALKSGISGKPKKFLQRTPI